MKNRIIPKKNYIIVGIITIVTLILTFALSTYYKNQKNYENEMNAIMSFLSEIKIEELDNFITENHDIMIYVSNSDINNNEIQVKVKKVINRNNYAKDIVYLNMKDLSEEFYASFASKYFDDKTNTNIVSDSLIIMKNGKVINIINITEENISDLVKIIESDFYGA